MFLLFSLSSLVILLVLHNHKGTKFHPNFKYQVNELISSILLLLFLQTLGWQKIRGELGLQLCIAGLVFAALSTSYNATLPPPEK